MNNFLPNKDSVIQQFKQSPMALSTMLRLQETLVHGKFTNKSNT